MHRRDYRRLLVVVWVALLHQIIMVASMVALEVRQVAPPGTGMVVIALYTLGWRWLTLAVMDDIIAEGASE